MKTQVASKDPTLQHLTRPSFEVYGPVFWKRQ
jgi:hypothetical protein